MPWHRFLNLVYHFAVRNAPKDKKQEFDNTMARAVSVDNMHQLAMTREKALSSLESDEHQPVVPQGTVGADTPRRSKLPPRPAGWGDAETATRQSLVVAQSLKVGARQHT